MPQESEDVGPVCFRCQKPVNNDLMGNTDNGLFLFFSGGYGEFHDDLVDGPHEVVLCHECGHDLADFLGLDVAGWHTHRPESGQHPDHHDEALAS